MVCAIAEQTDNLPGRDNGPMFYKFVFPLGVPYDIKSDTADTNLIGIDYLSIAIPAFVISVIWENIIIFGILPPDHRPKHTARFVDSMTSVGLGVLQVLMTQVLFLQVSGFGERHGV